MITDAPGLRVSVVMPAEVKTTSSEITAFASHVEGVGLDGIFVGDHLAPTGAQPDSSLVLAVTAAATARVAIGFSVMVLALRGPAWAAKQIATLQNLSNNRLILGVGAGGEMHGASAWQAVGVPYTERGRRTDAALRVLPGLVTGAKTTLENDAQLQLAPGAPMPPLWIGGMSQAALRRAAAFGDAWFPSMLLDAQLSTARSGLRALAEQNERPEPRLVLGAAAILGQPQPDIRDAFVQALIDGYGIPAARAERVPITGDVPQVADRLAEYAAADVDHLVIGLIGDDWQKTCDLLAQARARLTA
jgi:alkanesulfonate monooxygenase SsuD/methylene tetrahydromethanopterin reductase-like flavin-dependent oxidoreductase (luciferase family)